MAQVQPDKSLRQIGLGRRFLHIYRKSVELCYNKRRSRAPQLMVLPFPDQRAEHMRASCIALDQQALGEMRGEIELAVRPAAAHVQNVRGSVCDYSAAAAGELLEIAACGDVAVCLRAV